MDSNGKTFSPPYNIPWATFIGSVEKIAADLPNKVDRSYLGSMSGGLKSYLISAFRGFGLIDDDLTVTEELKTLATDPDKRPEMIGDLIREFYPKAVELGTSNSTTGELEAAFADMFPSVTGESRTKAIRFFLSACDFASVPRSSLWKTPKAGQTGARRGRPRKTTTTPEPQQHEQHHRPKQGVREFKLPSGRTLTIAIDGDVMALDRDERRFVMGIIDQIEEKLFDAAVDGTDSDSDDAVEQEEGVSTP